MKAGGHRERQEPAQASFDAKTREFQAFAESEFRQRQVMVPEIPIRALQVLDIGPKTDQSTAGLECSKGFGEGRTKCGLGRQVLEKVAGEHQVELAVAD